MTRIELLLGWVVFGLLPGQGVSGFGQADGPAHKAFTVLDEAASCTVRGVPYETKLDCAFAHARDWSEQTQQAATVELGSGVYETKTGLQMSASGGPAVNIKGAGKGEFQGGTTIKLIAPLTTGVLTYPFLNPDRQSGYWSDLHLESFTVDVNGNAPMCMDLYALRVAHFSDLSCMGATGPRAWIRIGGYGADIGGTVPKGMQGLAFQVMAQDIFVFNNGAGPGAVVHPRVVGGRIAEYTVQPGGLYREKVRAPVLLKGPSAGDVPCAEMPQGLEAQLVEDGAHPGMRRLARVVAQSSGSGCKNLLHVVVPDMPQAQYGFEIAATDSTFYDLTDDSVGTVAAITDRGSDAAVFYHPHGWNTTDMMDAWGHDSIVDAEIDSIYGYGIRVRYGELTTITRPLFVYVKDSAYDAAGDFFFDEGSHNTRIVDPVCPNRSPNVGYARFASRGGAFLPGYGSSRVAEGEPWLGPRPPGLTAEGALSCGSAAKLEPGVSVQDGFGAGEAVRGREIQWSAINRGKTAATPFLLAVLPAAGLTQGNAALRLTLAGGGLGAVPGEITATLMQGRLFSYRWRVSGRGESPKIVRLQAYRQADGKVNLYAALGAEASVAVKIDLVESPEILLMPEPEQLVPGGTLLFDSGDTAKYPPEPGR